MFFKLSTVPLLLMALPYLISTSHAEFMKNDNTPPGPESKVGSEESTRSYIKTKAPIHPMSRELGPVCQASGKSPLLHEARSTAELVSKMEDRWCAMDPNSNSLCRRLHCVERTCIGRCASDGNAAAAEITCKQASDAINRIIEMEKCRFLGPDGRVQDKVGGFVRLFTDETHTGYNDINLYTYGVGAMNKIKQVLPSLH